MDENETVARRLEAARHMFSDLNRLIEESCALSFVLAATLASSTGAELSQNELDNLCQSAYELFRRQKQIKQIFDDALEPLYNMSRTSP
jgi:hypothetical protein